MLRLAPPALLALAIALLLAADTVAAARTLLSEPRHLGLPGLPEWQEFASPPPDGRDLHLTFSATADNLAANARTESTLLIRQRSVKAAWHVTLNGHRLGALETLEQPLVRTLAIPVGLLHPGENANRLSITRAPSRMLDDIVLEEIALDPRPGATGLAEATIDVTVTADDSDQPLPCRLTLVDARSALAPLAPTPGQPLAVRTGVIYTGGGRARFGVAPGDYVLYASRGFEYSVAAANLSLSAGETKSLSLALRREVPTPGFIAADTHIHTLTHSGHGDATIDERMLTIAGEGIELAVATDHNHHTDFAAPAARMRVDRHFRSVTGNEVTTQAGHFNAFPIQPGSALPDARLTDWPHLLAHIRSVTGAKVITLNHPRDVHANFTPLGPDNFDASTGELLRSPTFDCDAIEVITSAAMHSDPMLLFRDWFALLNHGHRVAAIAASDTHDVSQFILGQARTYVASGTDDPHAIDLDDICASFRAGRVLVSFGLLTTLRVDDHFTVGDLATGLGDQLKIEIEVLGPSWIAADRVELYANGIKIREAAIASAGPPRKARLTWTLPRPRHDVHLVAIATGPGVTAPHWETPRPYQPTLKTFTPRVIGATNPIWIDGDGDGEYVAPRAQAAALLARFRADESALRAALADYDEAVRVQLADLLRSLAANRSGTRERLADERTDPSVSPP